MKAYQEKNVIRLHTYPHQGAVHHCGGVYGLKVKNCT